MAKEVGYSSDFFVRIEGLFTDSSDPASDLIHPSDFGMNEMGRNLAPK